MTGLGILVGPEVVRAGAVDGLRRFAAAVGSGVVNTWGAKGVFVWDDPFHFGTAGLQAEDFTLAGLADVEVLVTSGLDPDEVTARPWAGRAEVVDLAPQDLATAAAARSWPRGSLERPELYTALAAACGPLYASSAEPPPAAKRAAALAGDLPPGGLVVAEPGLVGFWVARTFPTSVPGSVCVPAAGGVEAAWSGAIAAAVPGRPVTLVSATTPPIEVRMSGVRSEVWGDGSVDLDPSALVAVAGRIVAWGGLAPS
jgi:thiamine pyrophosphate-dependent acetolactate synthase large subunit-like protein